jgi:hypothetical protein
LGATLKLHTLGLHGTLFQAFTDMLSMHTPNDHDAAGRALRKLKFPPHSAEDNRANLRHAIRTTDARRL